MALMKAFPNLYLSIGNNYGVHGGLEQLCRTLGADRLLFGTEFPNAEPMSAVSYLLYSALSDEVKEQIGCRTFETLAGGILR
jgi:predicted TIM-barrel fold metal-dependent hydrolase